MASAPGWGIAPQATQPSSGPGELPPGRGPCTRAGKALPAVPAAGLEASDMGCEGPKISKECRAAQSHTRYSDIGPMTHGCAMKQGPKCSGASPQRFGNLVISPVSGETPSLSASWLIRASPRAAVVRESKEKSNSWDFCCPSAPSLPRTASTRGAMGLGWHGPSSALHPRNTRPRWKERGEVYSDCGGVGSRGQRGRKSQDAS